MAEKTPVRVVFNESNVATGLAEFQSGDAVGVAFGGTGLNAIGSAGQVLKVNGAGTGLEFGAEGDISITNIVAPSNADLTFSTSGTGNIALDAVTVRGTTFSAADSTKITFAESVDVTGTLTAGGLSYPTSDGSTNQVLATNGSGTLSFISAASTGTLTFSGQTISGPSNADISIQPGGTGDVLLSALRVNGTTLDSSDSTKITIAENVDVTGTLSVAGALSSSTSLALASGATVTGIADEDNMSSNSATLLATQQSIKAYVDTQLTAEDLDFQADSGGALAIDLDSETMTFTGGTGIDTSGSGNTVTFAIDSTVATLTGSQTLTNKILTSPTINSPTIATPTVTGAMTATSVTSNDFTSNGSNADITIAPQGTGDINLTAGADVNIPANIGITFGNDAEKIEGDGTDLTITGNNIKLTATADVIIPTNVGLHFTDANEKIESDGSKLVITSGGTAFNLPTSDGSAGQALVTDGAGTLSFDSVSTTISDDTLATVRNNKHMGTQARSIDSINASFIDSAFYFLVYNDVLNEVVSAECLSVTNNDSASFLGNRRGINTTAGSNVPTLTTDVTNGQFRLRAAGSSADCLASFYKIAMSSSTADATRGNTVTTSNTDVDSASESIDTFAHGTYRGAKYFISVDNDSKTEMDVVEAIVVHDGSDAYIKSYGHNSSNGDSLITLTAAISGDNVVVSAAGLETNLNLTIHKILLKDNMTASSNANQKAFASVTVSSSATAIDLMDLDDANGAVYFIVGANSSEGAYSIQEVYTAATPGVPAVANGPYVSTKGTTQLEFTAGFDTSTENSLELFASSTSGGSTTVSGYRISALAG